MKHTVDCLVFKPLAKNTLVGFARIRVRELRLIIIEFETRAAGDTFSDAVWRAIDAVASLEKTAP